jgi:actin
MTEPCIIVIDNGSAITKAGFTVDKAPRVVFPTVTAREMEHSVTMHERDRKDTYIGHEAESMKHFVTMKYPIHRGIVTDLSDMEMIWGYIFSNELKIESERYPVLLTETALNPKINREKITEIMFETFSVPALYVAAQAVLSMYASDRITGLALDIGDGVSQIVPVYEGHAMAHATSRIDLGGHDLTDYMAQMLLERGYAFHTSAEKEIVRYIKEKLCYVALDFENETQKTSDPANIQKLYELPDGTIITFVEERFKCP